MKLLKYVREEHSLLSVFYTDGEEIPRYGGTRYPNLWVNLALVFFTIGVAGMVIRDINDRSSCKTIISKLSVTPIFYSGGERHPNPGSAGCSLYPRAAAFRSGLTKTDPFTGYGACGIFGGADGNAAVDCCCCKGPDCPLMEKIVAGSDDAHMLLDTM
jgi:hypothetical protein